MPTLQPSVAEATRAIDDLGALGVVLMSNAAGTYLGNETLTPLYELLDERGAILMVHPTSPPGWDAVSHGRPRPMVEFMFETTRTVTDMIFSAVVLRFPNIRLLVPHCGAAVPLLSSRIERFRSAGLGLNPDASEASTVEQLKRCWFDMAGYPFPHQIPSLVDVVGEGRILFGSDFCWTPKSAVDEHVRIIDAAPGPVSASSWRDLTSANAEQFLARPHAHPASSDRTCELTRDS